MITCWRGQSNQGGPGRHSGGSRVKRLAAAVGLSLVLIPLVGERAEADPVSTYFPSYGNLTTGQDSTSRYITNWMRWESARRLSGLWTSTGAYEHETHLPTFNCWENGFLGRDRGPHWDSNLPRAYLDWITVGDDYPNRAAGASDSLALTIDFWYYDFIRVVSGPCASQKTRVRGQRSHRSPDWCFDNSACVFADDLGDIVPYAAGWRAPSNSGVYRYNQLVNESFESCTQNWQNTFLPQGANWVCYGPGDPNPSYEVPWFVQFNSGPNAWTSVFQDVSFPVDPSRDLFRGEMAVRCPAGNPGTCPVVLAVWGLGNGPESFNYTVQIPRDGAWRHLWTGLHGFSRSHSAVRLEIYNNARNRNVDIDFATLHWTDKVA